MLPLKHRNPQRQARGLTGKTSARLISVGVLDMAEQVTPLLVGRNQLVQLLSSLSSVIALAADDGREGNSNSIGHLIDHRPFNQE